MSLWARVLGKDAEVNIQDGQGQRRPGYVPRGRIGVDWRFAWRLSGGGSWRPCESFNLEEMDALHQKRSQRQIPGPALQTNKDRSVVLLKWNGHLVHFNSRQGKAPVHGPGPQATYWASPLSLPFNYQQDGEYICLKKRMQSSSRNHARHDIHPARPPASDQHMGGAICAASPASPVDDEVNVGAPTCKFPNGIAMFPGPTLRCTAHAMAS